MTSGHTGSPTIRGLVFAGGGVLGCAHVGALQALIEGSAKLNMNNVSYFAGSSAGSIVAGLCACRIPINDIRKIIFDMNFEKLFDSSFDILRKLYRLWRYFGSNSSKNIKRMIETILLEHNVDIHITLQQVLDLYGSYLIIPVTIMQKKRCEVIYFTPETHADEKLANVIRYSCTYPLRFSSKNYYVDGGVLDNYPIQKLNEYIPLHEIIGFKFKHTDAEKIEYVESLYEFGESIISGLRHRLSRLNKDEQARTIMIYVRHYRSMDLDLTNEDKAIIYDFGLQSAHEFVTQRLLKRMEQHSKSSKLIPVLL